MYSCGLVGYVPTLYSVDSWCLLLVCVWCVCVCVCVCVCDIANDALLLTQLPKVKALRNDKREGLFVCLFLCLLYTE